MKNYKSITDSNKELLTAFKDEINNRHIVKVKTGSPKLDQMTYGFEPCNFWVITGDTHVGKSMLLGKFAYEVALQKHVVLYITREMSRLQLFKRIVSIRSGINYDKILKDKGLSQAKCYKRALFIAAREVVKLPIVYESDHSIGNIKERIHQYEPKLVIVDYIQDMTSGDKGHSDFQRLEYITQQLLHLAKYHRICVVAASQIHRLTAGEKIGMHSSKGSSGIEQKADIYATLAGDTDEQDNSPRQLKLSVLKGRHLYAKGTIDLVFDPSTLRIKEL